MQTVIYNNVQDEALDIVAEGIQFDHAFINWPRNVGQHPSIPDGAFFYGMVKSTMDLLNTQLKAGGMATLYLGLPGGDVEFAFTKWQEANPGVFEVIDAFNVWTGSLIKDRQTLLGLRRDDSYFKTIARVGDTVTKNDWVWDDGHQADYDTANMTLLGDREWPFASLKEGEVPPSDWWKQKKLFPSVAPDTYVPRFQYKLVEYVDTGTDTRTFIDCPTNPWLTADQNGELSAAQKALWINLYQLTSDPHTRALRTCITPGQDGSRSKMVGWNYWWMKNYTSPGDTVFIPFCAEGDAIVAALFAGRNFLALDANIHRAEISKDIVLEYNRLLPNGS
jgi:hypothetical protein